MIVLLKYTSCFTLSVDKLRACNLTHDMKYALQSVARVLFTVMGCALVMLSACASSEADDALRMTNS